MIADLAKIKRINQTRLENALSRVVNPPILASWLIVIFYKVTGIRVAHCKLQLIKEDKTLAEYFP
jgi:hypothetical protein